MERAELLIRRQARSGSRVSLLMFDLDHFKLINDRYGHAIGDAALRVFSENIQYTMREGDVIGRLGGEEFAALVAGSADEAAIAAERVRTAFEAAGVVIAGQSHVRHGQHRSGRLPGEGLQYRAPVVARRCRALCRQAKRP